MILIKLHRMSGVLNLMTRFSWMTENLDRRLER